MQEFLSLVPSFNQSGITFSPVTSEVLWMRMDRVYMSPPPGTGSGLVINTQTRVGTCGVLCKQSAHKDTTG